jgi:transcriptional regulator with XRE-family HTH domain
MGIQITRSVQLRKPPALLMTCNTPIHSLPKMQGMDYKAKIAKRIREARLEAGLTLRNLAESTDNIVSISRLNNYEHGTRMLGPAEAVLLGKALGKRPAYFLGVDDVQLPISTLEEELIRNWRALPENERMALARKLEAQALRYRDPVADDVVERHLGQVPKTVATRRRKSLPSPK